MNNIIDCYTLYVSVRQIYDILFYRVWLLYTFRNLEALHITNKDVDIQFNAHDAFL